MMHRTLVALFMVLCACTDRPATTSTSAPPSSSVAGSAGVCTPGADQTCNDDPEISSLHGTCNPDRTCTCKNPFVKNPQTGKCK